VKIERIVVATDFSAPARAALEQAVAIAVRFRARLYLFHAVDARALDDGEAYERGTPLDGLYQLAERRARDELRKLRAPLDATIPIVESIRLGAAADEVVAFANEKEADLVVVGTHGRTGIRRLLVGSVAESVLRQAECPVLAVRATESTETVDLSPETREPPPLFARVLVAIDHSESSRAALRAASALARSCGGAISVIHVLDDHILAQAASLAPLDAAALEGSFAQIARSDLDRFLRETLPEEEVAAITRSIELGGAAEVITRFAQEGRFDLIACGTHGRTGIRRALFGSTAERIVRLAPCPVFVVREGRAALRLAA
jgi:nucleotide-binding universal stress UspA family protein